MPNYQLKKPVPWRKILEYLNWFVDFRYRQCRESLRQQRQNSGVAVSADQKNLREACENYHALRAFLGYSGMTKAEQRAEALLNNRNE